MTEYQEAMRHFVLESVAYDRATSSGLWEVSPSQQEAAERSLAAAGDRLESVARQMMRDEAVKAHVSLIGSVQ